VKIEVQNWLKEVAGDLYETEIKKLVSRLIKCIEVNGDYGGKIM